MSKRPSNVRPRSNSVGPSSSTSRLSRLPIRDSAQTGHGKTLSRPGLEKRSIDRNIRRSKSTLGEPCVLNRQRSGSSLRLGTPSDQIRSVGKSPLQSSARKDSRPISDRKWQYEQVVKVRSFVMHNFPSLDHNLIKAGLSTDTFIMLMATFFKVIDKRIIITKENYVEEVPMRLRLFRYPTTIKPSQMKTVNLPHSWSVVIAILGWLTELILDITREEEDTNSLADIVERCFIQRYDLWNMGKEDTEEYEEPLKELEENLAKYYGVNLDELKELEEKKSSLESTLANYKDVNKKNNEEITTLREQCEVLENNCIKFTTASKQLEEQIVQKKDAVLKKITTLNNELEQLFGMEEDIKTRVKSQRFTLQQQIELKKEIENLENEIKLKEERCQLQKDQVHMYDHQLSDLNQKIQANAYKYNNLISELELTDPTLKELHIRENGFARNDTEQCFKKVRELLKSSITEAKNEIEILRNGMKDANEKDKKFQEELFTVNSELEEYLKASTELENMVKQKESKFALEKQLALEKLNIVRNQLQELQNNRPDIPSLVKELEEIHKTCDLAKERNEELEYKALEFFIQLDAQISNHILSYKKIMQNISKTVVEYQEAQIVASAKVVKVCKDFEKELYELKDKNKD